MPHFWYKKKVGEVLNYFSVNSPISGEIVMKDGLYLDHLIFLLPSDPFFLEPTTFLAPLENFI